MRTLVLGVVLLAVSIGTAQAADGDDHKYSTSGILAAHGGDRKECVREMYEIWENMAKAKRLCDPQNRITNPNEYGWVRSAPECPAKRVKGAGWKLLKDAPCE